MTLSGIMLTDKLVKDLDATGLSVLKDEHRDFRLITEYATGQGHWREGDGTPAIVADGPAAANAIGRCVANRVRYGLREIGVSAGNIHSSRCGWCDYPKDVLLVTLDHATWRSRYVVTEYLVWPAKNGHYSRATGRAGEYDNPSWAPFFRGVTPSTSKHPPSDLTNWRAIRTAEIARAAE